MKLILQKLFRIENVKFRHFVPGHGIIKETCFWCTIVKLNKPTKFSLIYIKRLNRFRDKIFILITYKQIGRKPS